jgi:hypothetical protein
VSKSTAPILLTGGVSYCNQVFGNGKSPTSELRILVGTGIAAVGLALVEQIPGAAPLASGLAWIAFVTCLIAPFGGASPIQNLTKVTGF